MQLVDILADWLEEAADGEAYSMFKAMDDSELFDVSMMDYWSADDIKAVAIEHLGRSDK